VIVRTADTDAVALAGIHIGFLANADDALGAMGLVEYTAPPFFPGPPTHVHDHTWNGSSLASRPARPASGRYRLLIEALFFR